MIIIKIFEPSHCTNGFDLSFAKNLGPRGHGPLIAHSSRALYGDFGHYSNKHLTLSKKRNEENKKARKQESKKARKQESKKARKQESKKARKQESKKARKQEKTRQDKTRMDTWNVHKSGNIQI
jgi:hypothetical protein